MDAHDRMRALLQKIATGPELSKDLSVEEAYDGMRMILYHQIDPVQAGLFLIALRMKRESDDEMRGVLKALLEETHREQARVDDLVEISDPFNGYNRGLPVSPFLPVVLAACGVPSCCHGVKTVGPKYGITHHNVLRAAGVDIGLSMTDAVDRISDPRIGWAYLDQSVTCPNLHRLIELRDLMVKRTCLTTIEVSLKPISARKRTHLVTGFVHKPYPPIYTMLARHAGYQSAMVVRGVEGGVVPSLQQPSKIVHYTEPGQDQEWRIEPEMAELAQCSHRAQPLPENVTSNNNGNAGLDVDGAATAAAKAGVEALEGKPGLAYDSLVYAAALVLAHIKGDPVQKCALSIRAVLDTGAAAARFKMQ